MFVLSTGLSGAGLPVDRWMALCYSQPIMHCLRGIVSAVLVVAVVSGTAALSAAVDAQPTSEQIRAALARGKEAARQHRPPDIFYTRFGATNELGPSGFLLTKLGSLAVMASHMALRGLEPTQYDITQVIEAPTMLVSVVIFGDVPSFARDSYMVLEQGAQTIKPVTVRFDGLADRSASWPDQPRFKAKVVASFNYADFDQAAKTTITVFPTQGGAVRFSLDFAQIE